MATKEKIIEEKNFALDRISNQVRTLSLSVLAFVWLFLVGGDDAPSLPTPPDRGALLLAGLFALLSLVTDYLQYVLNWKTTQHVIREGEKNGVTNFTYDYNSLTYRASEMCFSAKQILMVFSLLLLGCGVIAGFV